MELQNFPIIYFLRAQNGAANSLAKRLVFFLQRILFYWLFCSDLITRTTSILSNRIFFWYKKKLLKDWKWWRRDKNFWVYIEAMPFVVPSWVSLLRVDHWLTFKNQTRQESCHENSTMSCQQFSTVSFISNLLMCVLSSLKLPVNGTLVLSGWTIRIIA